MVPLSLRPWPIHFDVSDDAEIAKNVALLSDASACTVGLQRMASISLTVMQEATVDSRRPKHWSQRLDASYSLPTAKECADLTRKTRESHLRQHRLARARRPLKSTLQWSRE